ncbi:MAG TPA: hypothetical protein VGU01_06855 [Sphingomicrobium sp.]|nr:hypothetical protein [Sphingomicrobium sp.]
MGKRRDRFDPLSDSSSVGGRRLDEVKWAVTEYDFETGDFVLMRGVKPVEPFAEAPDPDAASYKEGAERLAFRRHRHREWRARRDKIAAALKANGGRLVCEVPKCGFDFESKYGAIGKGFAHVHHLGALGKASAKERETKLNDLAVVCANCHAMIHVGGECRELGAIIV